MAETERQKLLQDSINLVNGERNVDYGDPFDDFQTTAMFWQTYLERVMAKKQALFLEAHDVAVMMTLLKVSRLSWSPNKRDHWLDIAGYSACGWDCVDKIIGTVKDEAQPSLFDWNELREDRI
jgi:hypothetical protein